MIIILKLLKKLNLYLKQLAKRKSPGTYDLTGKFYQTFGEDMTPILDSLFQNTEENTFSFI